MNRFTSRRVAFRCPSTDVQRRLGTTGLAAQVAYDGPFEPAPWPCAVCLAESRRWVYDSA